MKIPKAQRTFVHVGKHLCSSLIVTDDWECLDVLPPSTHYAVIVLPNGGTDLESYSFSAETGWKASVSVLWQVTRSLAVAEDSHQFEVGLHH